ncbi:MAG TPA: ATP-binding protein [Myxococcales bacterium]
MRRKLFLAAATLTALELGFDALILLAFLPLERQDAIGAAISLAPVLAVSTLSWLLAPVRWLRGMEGDQGLDFARRAVLRYPRRTLLYRSMGVGALGLALAPALAGLFGVGTEAAFVIAGTIATVGFVTNVARAGVYRRLLSPLAEKHWSSEPARYQALCLRERLVVATVMVGTVGVVASGLFVRYVVGVPAPDLAVAALAAPAVIALTLSVHCLDLWLSTAPLVAFLGGDKKPAASDALRIASAVPYRSAASSFLGWLCFAVVSALVHRARGGLSSEALQMLAGVSAVGIGLMPYQLAWHRQVLERVRAAAAASIVAGELSPARSRLSIRTKLVIAFVALIAFGGTFAALGTFGEHDRFLAAAAGAEAAHRRDTLLDGLGERAKAAAADPGRLQQLARELSGPQGRVLALYDGQVLGTPEIALPPRLADAVRRGEPAYGALPRLAASLATRPVGPSAALGVLRPWRDPGRRDIVPLLFVFAALGLASAGLVLITVQELTGPLRALSAGARQMGAGDLSRPIAPPDSDEMGELAAAMEWARRELASKVRSIEELNASLEQRVKERTAELQKANGELATTLEQLQAARAEVVHAEKMASLGRLVAGIAHEINNPLNFVQNGLAPLKAALGQLSQLAALCPPPGASEAELVASARAASELRSRAGLDATLQDVEDLLRVMGNGVTRMGAIVRALRDFSRQSASETPEPAELERLVDDAAALLRHDLKGRVELVKKLSPTGPVLCQPGPLTQVFLNLLKNAAQAMDGPGTITVSSATVEGGVEIRVADTGQGIPAEELPKIFEPFYTTKPVGEGTGLGLAIVHGIVEKHGGRIACSSRPGEGTQFTIFLPQPIAAARDVAASDG